MTNPFDSDYFLRGQETGKSNYTDYRWLEAPTMALAQSVINTLGIKRDESLVDIGCARGYAVKALRRLGINAVGYDISAWAIKNCDPEVAQYVSTAMPPQADYVLAKDTLEHVPIDTLHSYTDWIFKTCEKTALIIVPLSAVKDGNYVRQEDEKDATHIHRWPLMSWVEFFFNKSPDNWSVHGSWHIPGLKPTSLNPVGSCGFITLRRQPL